MLAVRSTGIAGDARRLIVHQDGVARIQDRGARTRQLDPRYFPQTRVRWSFGRSRASRAATARATRNAGRPARIGQIRRARSSERWLPVPVVSAWIFAAAASAKAARATEAAAWSAVLRGA